MDPAIAAGWFAFLERTVVQAFAGVVKQLPAIATEPGLRWPPVMGPAVDIDHGGDRPQFTS